MATRTALAFCTSICFAIGMGCSARPDAKFITISRQRFVLTDAAGGQHPFTPWGFNYDRTVLNGRDVLLEEVLDRQPEKVAVDFAAMRQLNGNVARVFLSTAGMLTAPEQVSLEGLARLDQLLAAARSSGIKLILVGLANIEPTAAPSWYQQLDDEQMAIAEETFWRAVATRCRNEPAVFAYDIQNEPVIAWTDSSEWTVGCFDMPANRQFCYCHRHYRRISQKWTAHIHSRFADENTLRRHWSDYPRPDESWSNIAIPRFDGKDPRFAEYAAFHEQLLSDWAKHLANVIRSRDSRHLITAGALQPAVMFDAVDFCCLHLYPKSQPPADAGLQATLDQWKKQMQAIPPGKPLIIEEFYPLSGPEGVSWETLLDALLRVTRPQASGWISFYWGPPAEVAHGNAMHQACLQKWLELWSHGQPCGTP